jgi:hypothetical protein
MILQLAKDQFPSFTALVRKIGGVQAVLYSVPGGGQDVRFCAILGVSQSAIIGNATDGQLTATNITDEFPDAIQLAVLDARITSVDSVALLA